MESYFRGVLAGFSGLLTAAVAFTSCISTGCQNPQTTKDVMEFLKEGKARGHAQVGVTEKPLQVGATQSFFAGPGVTVMFDGDVNFGAGLTGNIDVAKPTTAEKASAAAGGK